MANRHLINPIEIIPPNRCPKCRKGYIGIRSIEVNYYKLDANGNPYYLDGTEGQYLASCTNCDYTSNNWFPTEKGFTFIAPWNQSAMLKDHLPLDLVNDHIEERTFKGNPFTTES